MADAAKITQNLLDNITNYVATSLLKYMGFGTGSTDIALTTEDVATPVSVESGVRNLKIEDRTIDGNFFRLHFVLTSPMPTSQPADIQQIGLHDAVADTSGMFWGHTFAVAITKDSDSQWDIWVSGRVVELDTV